LFDPVSVAVDAFGNVFIADQGNNRIRKVAPSGVITTFAGTGVQGTGGDGGPATLAELLHAQAVALDNTGRVYIGECSGTLRVVETTGVINTVDPGFSCVSALTVDSANNVYASGGYLSQPQVIFEVSPTGTVTPIAGVGGNGYSGDGGPAINAQFNGPAGLAFDNRSGILYVADENNHRVRAIYPSGVVQTVAGTGVPGFSGDGGLGIAAQLKYPSGVAVDTTGNVYIADSGNSRIRMLTAAGLISTVGGDGTEDQGPAPFPFPGGGLPRERGWRASSFGSD
jgi:sugar lactone lactonase YvrE